MSLALNPPLPDHAAAWRPPERNLLMPALPRPRFARRRARTPLAAVVDYRVGPFIRWSATVSSPAGEFDLRVVVAADAEGIYLAALTALDDLRRETGRLVEAEHVLHDDLVPA